MRGTTSTTMFEWTGRGAEDEECALVGYCESLNLHIRTPSTTCPCCMCATPFIYGNRTQHSRLDCRHSQPASHMRCEHSMYMLHTTYLNGGHCARWSSASAAGGLGGRLGRGAEFGFACIRLRGNRPFVRATVTRLR